MENKDQNNIQELKNRLATEKSYPEQLKILAQLTQLGDSQSRYKLYKELVRLKTQKEKEGNVMAKYWLEDVDKIINVNNLINDMKEKIEKAEEKRSPEQLVRKVYQQRTESAGPYEKIDLMIESCRKGNSKACLDLYQTSYALQELWEKTKNAPTKAWLDYIYENAKDLLERMEEIMKKY